MDAKLQRRIQRYGWDKAVDLYEHHWQQQLAPAQARLLEMADIRPGERVLDVACGTGLVTCHVARQVGESRTVIGVDVAGKMVAYAEQVAANQRLRQVTWARMDAEELLLPDGTFDVALCALGLMYVPHPVKALQEMYRVLKPGGRAVAAVWGRRDRCGWAEVFPIVDARVTTESAPCSFTSAHTICSRKRLPQRDLRIWSATVSRRSSPMPPPRRHAVRPLPVGQWPWPTRGSMLAHAKQLTLST